MLDGIKTVMTWVIENKILIGAFFSTVAGLTVFTIRLWLRVKAARAATQTLTDSIELADTAPELTDGSAKAVKRLVQGSDISQPAREFLELAVENSRFAVGGGK